MSASFIMQPDPSSLDDFTNSQGPNINDLDGISIADQTPGDPSPQQSLPFIHRNNWNIQENTSKANRKQTLLDFSGDHNRKSPLDKLSKDPTTKIDPNRSGLLTTILAREAEDPKRIDRLKNLWALRKQIHREQIGSLPPRKELRSEPSKELAPLQNKSPILATIVKVKELLKKKKSLAFEKADSSKAIHGLSFQKESGENTGSQNIEGLIGKHLLTRKLKNPQEQNLMSGPASRKISGGLNYIDQSFDLNKPHHSNSKGKDKRVDIPKEYQVDDHISFKFFYQRFKNPSARGTSCPRKASKGQESPQLNCSFDYIQKPRKVTLSKIEEFDYKHENRLHTSFQSASYISPVQMTEYNQTRRRGRTLSKKPNTASEVNPDFPTKGIKADPADTNQRSESMLSYNGSRKEHGRTLKKPEKVRNYPTDGSFATLKSFFRK